MIIKYAPEFFNKLKKLNVRIRHQFKQRVLRFSKNPDDPILRKHELHGEWKGYISININADWRALYEEIDQRGEIIAYFSYIGTHKDLYGW